MTVLNGNLSSLFFRLLDSLMNLFGIFKSCLRIHLLEFKSMVFFLILYLCPGPFNRDVPLLLFFLSLLLMPCTISLEITLFIPKLMGFLSLIILSFLISNLQMILRFSLNYLVVIFNILILTWPVWDHFWSSHFQIQIYCAWLERGASWLVSPVWILMGWT